MEEKTVRAGILIVCVIVAGILLVQAIGGFMHSAVRGGQA